MCLPRALYREQHQKEETAAAHYQPFACLCGSLDSLTCSMELATEGAATGFSLSTMMFFLMLAIFTVMVRRHTSFITYKNSRESCITRRGESLWEDSPR